MFRFYLNSEYRRVYGELSGMELLSEAMVVRFADYQEYFRHLVIIDPGIERQVEVLQREKPSAVKVVKALLLVHAWLQATCVIEQPEHVLGFINGLFAQVGQLAARLRADRSAAERKLSRSAVLREQGVRVSQLQSSKEVFILQQVARPYLYYLQKLVSIFDFYNSLKKNFIRPMNASEVWVLVNLFRCILKVTSHLSSICQFVRRSYRPLAEAIAEAFSQVVYNFYPNLFKYCYGAVARMRTALFVAEGEVGEEEAFRRSAEGVEGLVALLEEVAQVNRGLSEFLQQPLLQEVDSLYLPKLIDVGGSEFELIFHLHKLKKNGYPNVVGSLATPKFFISHGSQPTENDEPQQQVREGKEGMKVFQDISNQEVVMTFRKEKQGRISRMKRRVSQESMGER